jgi:prepilin-type processing-associated H-X9-DG protein
LTSEIGDLSKTLVFGDSVWQVTADGRPTGGGSYLIVPPCRYVASDRSDSFNLSGYDNNRVYAVAKGWGDPQPPRRLKYGGLWPWHNGRLTTVMADGSAKSRTLSQLAEGCEVAPGWAGKILETGTYIWDLR